MLRSTPVLVASLNTFLRRWLSWLPLNKKSGCWGKSNTFAGGLDAGKELDSDPLVGAELDSGEELPEASDEPDSGAELDSGDELDPDPLAGAELEEGSWLPDIGGELDPDPLVGAGLEEDSWLPDVGDGLDSAPLAEDEPGADDELAPPPPCSGAHDVMLAEPQSGTRFCWI